MNFHKIKDGEHIIYSPIGHLMDSSETLKSGVYRVTNGSGPMQGYIPSFVPIKGGENLINFEGGVSKKILNKMKEFFSEETKEKYKFLKNTHKMGLILHGPQGTGKTCIANLLMLQEVKSHEAICLDFTGEDIHRIIFTINLIRKYQSTPIIIFYDEFEQIAEDYILLTFLDGNLSFDNVVFIGCTNFLNLIPDRIKNRKSRVKHLFEVKTLPTEVYREYIKGKLPDLEKKLLDEYVYKAAEADLTIDQLKNSIIDYYVDGTPIDKAIKEAKKLDKMDVGGEDDL